MGKGRLSKKVDLSDLIVDLDDLLPEADRDARVAEKEEKKKGYSSVKSALQRIRDEIARTEPRAAPERSRIECFVTFWLRTRCTCGSVFESPKSLTPLTKHVFRNRIEYRDEPWRDPNSLHYEIVWAERSIGRCHLCLRTKPHYFPLVPVGPLLRADDLPPLRVAHTTIVDAEVILSAQHLVRRRPARFASPDSAPAGTGGSHIRELQHDIDTIRFAYSIVEELNSPSLEDLLDD